MTQPHLNLNVADLEFNGKSVDLIIHSLALECHEAALASGIFSESIVSQLRFVMCEFEGDTSDLLDFSSVITGKAPCIATISVRFSNEGYLRIARAAKDRATRALDVDADIIGVGHE
jgi:hypothetical protein